MTVAVYDMAGRIVESLRCMADESSGLQKLVDNMSSIRKLLVDAEKKQHGNDKVRDWITEVEDALHHVENLVDEFGLHVSDSAGRRNIFSSGSCFNHRVGIKKCMKEWDRLANNRSSLDLEEEQLQVPNGDDDRWKSICCSVPGESIKLKREHEKRTILQDLLRVYYDQESVPILPIVGVAGIGKTTLAQLVYNDDMVRSHFELRMWVHVSRPFDYYVVLKKIFQFVSDSTNLMSLEDIRSIEKDIELTMDYIEKEIARKRFLLVLDDMCMDENCEEEWNRFKQYLPIDGAKRGSRIILATRDEGVARMAGTMQACHLRGLDEEQSWSLFEGFFPDVRKVSNNSVPILEMGKEIVENCEGNPFLLQAISGMMLFRDPETQWCSMEKDLLKIFRNKRDILSTTAQLSYENLPSNLKKCFAYCSLFPKDYEIDVLTLIKLWISEGIITTTSNDPVVLLEDLGYECFVNLLWRSFFEESERDDMGKVTKCKMQTLMHDAMSMFGKRYITFGSRIGGEISVRRTRHVSFDLHLDSLWQIPSSLIQAKEIRTVLLLGQLLWEIGGRSDESICGVIVSKFKSLRTLDMHNTGIKVVPDSIGQLKFLRYLDLSQNTDIKELPKSLTKLQYLQTLKLNNCGRLRKLPGDIKKLTKLRNLEINSCYSLTHMPRGLGKLTHLQTLSEFVWRVSTHTIKRAGGLEELGTLNNLRGQLRIRNLNPGECTKAAKLSEKQFLQSLMLIWEIGATVKFAGSDYEKSLENLQPHSNLKELSLSAYGGSKFPTWLPSHTNLVKFFLWGCTKCLYLPPLNHLPSLKVLVLEEMKELLAISYSEEESSELIFFPSLKELRLTNLPKLEGWQGSQVGNGSGEAKIFPCLSKLIIEDCPAMTGSMPQFPHLEELLVLQNTRWEPLQQTINTAQQVLPVPVDTASTSSGITASNSSSTTPLSKLRNLCLVNMSPFHKSERLHDHHDDRTRNLWPFQSLESLRSLRSLTLDHVPQVEDVLRSFQRVTGLQELHIWRCDSLWEIPTWIPDFESLLNLSIKLCPNLTIPPERIGLVTSIQKVEIEDCPHISYVENLLKDRIFKR